MGLKTDVRKTFISAPQIDVVSTSPLLGCFSVFLDITAGNLSPLPAAACFVDPCVAETLLENEDELQNLVRKAEDYIAHLVP